MLLVSGRLARVTTRLLTVGHGTLAQDAFAGLLQGAGVTTLVDVRRFPGSRRHPHFGTDTMAQWLPPTGVDYRWEPRLGGRRNLRADEDTDDPWWTVKAFRAYAGYTRTPEFAEAMSELLDGLGAGGETTVMCSESLWWRCHRRLVSDVAVLLHDVPVLHLAHSGRLSPHPPAAGARVAEDGLRYDVVE
jgi:uncharacterized protein (DUF488 family)